MSLLEPGFALGDAPTTIGRLRLPTAPHIDAAIDQALSAFTVTELDAEMVQAWSVATAPTAVLLAAEAWDAQHELVEQDPGGIGADVLGRLRTGAQVSDAERLVVRQVQAAWLWHLDAAFNRVDVIACPTLLDDPPLLDEAVRMYDLRATLPVNLAGLPAVSIPLPGRALPVSLQLVGPAGSEERLLAAAAVVEADHLRH